MRRGVFCVSALVAPVALASLLAPGVVVARSVADDFGAALAHTALVSTRSGGATSGQPFTISAQVPWNGAQNAAGDVRVVVTLPAGVSWSGPAAGPGCTRSGGQATCVARVTPGQGTNLAAAFGLGAVVASSPGAYTFSASVTAMSAPDPNPANDTASMQVDVGSAPTGGVPLRPARPTAGATVVAAMSVWSRTDQTTFPLESGSVSCVAKVGTAKAPAKGALSSGRATCTIKTGTSAKGKTLRGTITASAGGARLTKPFSTVLR